MTRKELIRKVSDKTGVTRKSAEAILSEAFGLIMHEVATSKRVRITGFGTFEIRTVEERRYINPVNGQEGTTPSHNKIRFKAARCFKDMVNEEIKEEENKG